MDAPVPERAAGRVVAAAPPDLGVPAAWVACGIARAHVLRDEAGDGHGLPQAAQARAGMAARVKAQGWGPVRLVMRAAPDPAEILRLLWAWDARRGRVTWANGAMLGSCRNGRAGCMDGQWR